LKSWLFQASIRNCLNCVHNCDDHIAYLISKSAVQYMKHFTYHFTSILHRLIRTYKMTSSQRQWLYSSVALVRASHGFCKVTGSNPIEVLTFSGFYTQLPKLRL